MEIREHILVIENEKKIKNNIRHSSGIGLVNLNERFKIITGKPIAIKNDQDSFGLSLPLMKINN